MLKGGEDLSETRPNVIHQDTTKLVSAHNILSFVQKDESIQRLVITQAMTGFKPY
jgi:hypothetical protein